MLIKIIRTGGTIESVETENGLTPKVIDFSFLENDMAKLEYDFPFTKDSTDICANDILKIAEIIRNSDADGFVITHGTDTLSYTAAALSFLLSDTSKPIILTGSMLPLGAEGTDAVDNLKNSLNAACNPKNAGVYVMMNSKLIHGAKAVKLSTNSIDSFSSADNSNGGFKKSQPIGDKLDGKIQVEYLTVFTKEIKKTDADAILLCAYGSGNVPATLNIPDVPCFLVSQCPTGVVDSAVYQSGKSALDKGIVPLNMTFSAALMKLVIAYSQENNTQINDIVSNCCGECLVSLDNIQDI